MLPVLEDSVLALRAAEGQLTVSDLLSYSAVCGVGLDTVPLPGDTSEDTLTGILLDVAALATRLNKPLTARLILPSFGSIRLKLAQRAIGTQRIRTASTLLALIIGMGGLSVLLLFTQSVLNLIDTTFEQAVGGNVLVIPQSSETTDEVLNTLDALPDITSMQVSQTFSAEIVAINGNTDMESLIAAAREAGEAEIGSDPEAAAEAAEVAAASQQGGQGFQGGGGGFNPVDFQISFLVEQLTLQKTEGADPYTVSAGEDISAESRPEHCATRESGKQLVQPRSRRFDHDALQR